MNNDRFKVRVWDKQKNKMQSEYKDFYISCSDGDLFIEDIYDSSGNIDSVPEYRFIKMQCTGFKDKEGNLIWEGDILIDPAEGGEDFKVVFDEDNREWTGVDIQNSDYKESLCELMFAFEDGPYLITGNIYENPELLEELK
jgi:uncharacterized phage protein (TIGR01671 family)